MKHKFTLKNQEILSIRNAQVSDAAKAVEFLNSVAYETDFLSFGGGEFYKTVQEEEAFIKKVQVSDNQLFVLAQIGEEIAAMLTVSASSKKRFRHVGEFGISVYRKHWGKGIGNILMEYMLDWAKETKVIRKLNLKVRSDNQSAIALYQKFGFETEGLLRRDALIHGIFYDTYTMGLLID